MRPPIIYAIHSDSSLRWHQHTGASDGTKNWQLASTSVGRGWNFAHVFATESGAIYGAKKAQIDRRTGRTTGGHLHWYRHRGWHDGTDTWAAASGSKTEKRWPFLHMCSGPEGVLYAVNDNLELLWFRHEATIDGRSPRVIAAPEPVGTGWDFSHIFSGSDGIIYAVTGDGQLLWYRHDGWRDGTYQWAAGSGNVVSTGGGWDFAHVTGAGDGLIYGVTRPVLNPATGGHTGGGDLLWYRHLGSGNGTPDWAPNSGAVVAEGWGHLKAVFAMPNQGVDVR